MRRVTAGEFAVELDEEGSGPPAVLLHASAIRRGQWRALSAMLRGRRRVIAPDLPGYGGTERLAGTALDGLAEPAAMVQALAAAEAGSVGDAPPPAGAIDLVGHSWGAAVALEAALRLGPAARRLVLYEPNLFGLLGGPLRAEAESLHESIRQAVATGDCAEAAASFTAYFSGPAVWAGLPAPQRGAIAAALPTNLGEWSAVTAPSITVERWRDVSAPALLMTAADSRPTLLAVADVLAEAFPRWRTLRLPRGGHMAPLTRATSFNAAVVDFLLS